MARPPARVGLMGTSGIASHGQGPLRATAGVVLPAALSGPQGHSLSKGEGQEGRR